MSAIKLNFVYNFTGFIIILVDRNKEIMMAWSVYLSGEIHTDWREKIIQGCKEEGLDIVFTSAVTDHESSDAAGDGLGVGSTSFR